MFLFSPSVNQGIHEHLLPSAAHSEFSTIYRRQRAAVVFHFPLTLDKDLIGFSAFSILSLQVVHFMPFSVNRTIEVTF